MKRSVVLIIFLAAAAINFTSCRHNTEKKVITPVTSGVSDTAGLILAGRNMITDIVVKPDTTGDPWEVEKVKGFSGEKMFRTLLDNIYNGKATVYDFREDRVLDKNEVKALEKEFDSDISRIGKVQFIEDWYFDPVKNTIIKKVKSVSFGFSMGPSGDKAARFKALFKLKP